MLRPAARAPQGNPLPLLGGGAVLGRGVRGRRRGGRRGGRRRGGDRRRGRAGRAAARGRGVGRAGRAARLVFLHTLGLHHGLVVLGLRFLHAVLVLVALHGLARFLVGLVRIVGRLASRLGLVVGCEGREAERGREGGDEC